MTRTEAITWVKTLTDKQRHLEAEIAALRCKYALALQEVDQELAAAQEALAGIDSGQDATQDAKVEELIERAVATPPPHFNCRSVEPGDPFEGAEVISSYSRAQAIEDGFLVDVTETAREIGIKCPVAVTRQVWEDCCEWTDEDNKRSKACGQSASGRLHDVLWMMSCSIRGAKGNTVFFQVSRHPRPGNGKTRTALLKAVLGPGDNRESVITVMGREED